MPTYEVMTIVTEKHLRTYTVHATDGDEACSVFNEQGNFTDEIVDDTSDEKVISMECIDANP